MSSGAFDGAPSRISGQSVRLLWAWRGASETSPRKDSTQPVVAWIVVIDGFPSSRPVTMASTHSTAEGGDSFSPRLRTDAAAICPRDQRSIARAPADRASEGGGPYRRGRGRVGRRPSRFEP